MNIDLPEKLIADLGVDRRKRNWKSPGRRTSDRRRVRWRFLYVAAGATLAEVIRLLWTLSGLLW